MSSNVFVCAYDNWVEAILSNYEWIITNSKEINS